MRRRNRQQPRRVTNHDGLRRSVYDDPPSRHTITNQWIPMVPNRAKMGVLATRRRNRQKLRRRAPAVLKGVSSLNYLRDRPLVRAANAVVPMPRFSLASPAAGVCCDVAMWRVASVCVGCVWADAVGGCVCRISRGCGCVHNAHLRTCIQGIMTQVHNNRTFTNMRVPQTAFPASSHKLRSLFYDVFHDIIKKSAMRRI